MINKIHGKNVKGSTFETTLFPVTLIAGANFAGKTTRLDTLMLAVAGFVPNVGRTTPDIYRRLASASPMVAGVEATDFSITRTYTLGREDKVSCKVTAAGVEEDFAVAPVSVDAGTYFALSDTERVKFIFQRIQSEVTIASLSATLTANIKQAKFEENTPATEEAIKQAITDLGEYFDDAERNEVVINEVVALIVGDFKEKLNAANANAKRLDSGVQSLTQVAQDVVIPANIETKIGQAKTELNAANESVGQCRAKVTEISGQLQGARTKAEQVTDESATLAKIEELTRQRVESEKVKQPAPFDVAKFPLSDEVKAGQAELSARKAVLFTAAQEPKPNMDSAAARKREIESRLDKADSNVQLLNSDLNKLIAEFEKTSRTPTCLTCGQSVVELMGKVLKLIDEKTVATRSALENAKLILAGVNDEYQSICGEVASIHKKIEQHDANSLEYRALETETLALNASIEPAARAAWDATNNSYIAAQRNVNRLNDEITTLRAKLEDKSAATAAAQIPQLEADLVKSTAARDAALNAAATAQTHLTTLEAQGKLLVKQRSEAATRQTMIDDAQAAKAKATVLKAVCELLIELQAKVVTKAIEPLLNRVNAICGSILPHALSYDDKTGEIGFKIGNSFAVRAISGTEQALVYCAISIALSKDSKNGLKIAMIDEIGVMEKHIRLRLVNHLLNLVCDKVIDQAIVVDTNADAFLVKKNPNEVLSEMIIDPHLTEQGFGVVNV